ncbi:pentatricopeptide repeat domain-containing protein 3, mitochondrial [Scophthalmus maximus]|nr:pentatricopeptide repeat domain-containing protein 3, mitochondrial [Scophthalmus maximus]
MAASGRHVGHHLHRNGRFLTSNLEPLWGRRNFGWTPALRQQAAEANKESTENIVIPRKKTWSKEAVLEALASTVSSNPTAYKYQFQDDPYLSPRSSTEFSLFLFAHESGRSAAKYFINNNPKFFTKDFAEPHIPCLMPETVSLVLEEVSEEALKERITLRKVKASVDMYDQLLQAGTAVSIETTHNLLDLICLYCDREPVEGGGPQTEDTEPGEGVKKRKIRFQQSLVSPKCTWEENNNAERLFNVLPERDTRCYSALIRGMAKHGAYEKAFSMYTGLLNERLKADIHIFNALIISAPNVREKYTERWELINELLTHMKEQEVRPNLLTFNNVLQALKRCGTVAKSKSLQTLYEMKALGIAPSLTTYSYILEIFSRTAGVVQTTSNMLPEIMSELSGKSFTCQGPNDGAFFINTMKMCLESIDLEQGYKIQSLLECGENWRLLGASFHQGIYYGTFFRLLCEREHIDVVLKWYKKLIPTHFYPNSQGLGKLLQALDAGNRLDLLPQIWQDIRTLHHEDKSHLVEELLSLMTRDKHSPEVQESFAACALDVKGVFEIVAHGPPLEWSPSSLKNITSLLLRANKTQQAWEVLQLFKSKNRIPPNQLLDDFLSACHSSGSAERALDLVRLSAAFDLPATAELAKRTLAEFQLTEEQRAILSDLVSVTEFSD